MSKYEYSVTRVNDKRLMLEVETREKQFGTVREYALFDVDAYERAYYMAGGNKEEFGAELDNLIAHLTNIRGDLK